MNLTELSAHVRSTMKSEDTEGKFELYVTRTPGFLWALFFKKLHIHPIAVTILSIIIGAAAGFFFWFENIYMNLIGMLLLIWANWYDCADGQLARMTGKTTLIGRILDGFAGDVWFFSIYVFLALRLNDSWGIWIWIIGAFAGFHCHAKQCALADYYRNIHLYFLKGEQGSELDRYQQQLDKMHSLKWSKGEWFEKMYLFFYSRYTHGQEKMTPKFQRYFRLLQQEYGNNIPREVRAQFRQASLPLMKFANILTFDARVGVLFLSLLINQLWIYFFFEIVILEALRYYTRHTHEAFCEQFTQELISRRSKSVE